MTWRVTPDLLGILDSEGQFKHTNPAWAIVLGREPEDIEHRQFFELIHPDDIAKTEQAFLEIQRGEPILQFENRYRHKDGSYRWLSWNAVPEGDVYFCNARDITKAKENESAIAEHAQQLRLREQFLRVLGHDLRNPLAAVTSALRIIGRRHADPGTAHVVDMAQKSADRMGQIVNDVQDFARFSLGSEKVAMRFEPNVQLVPIIEEASDRVRGANPFATILLDFSFEDGIACDAARIGQFVEKMLTNAIDHGAADQPIRAQVTDMDEGVILEISNQGNPIPEETLPLLFQPFHRASKDKTRDGLGLGLYICKKIADGHNGTLEVASSDDETSFKLTLPRHQAVAVG